MSDKVDNIVQSVINQHIQRAQLGKEKYGVTLDRKDLSIVEWLEHAKEEAMDFVLYLEKAIQSIKEKENSGNSITKREGSSNLEKS